MCLGEMRICSCDSKLHQGYFITRNVCVFLILCGRMERPAKMVKHMGTLLERSFLCLDSRFPKSDPQVKIHTNGAVNPEVHTCLQIPHNPNLSCFLDICNPKIKFMLLHQIHLIKDFTYLCILICIQV